MPEACFWYTIYDLPSAEHFSRSSRPLGARTVLQRGGGSPGLVLGKFGTPWRGFRVPLERGTFFRTNIICDLESGEHVSGSSRPLGPGTVI